MYDGPWADATVASARAAARERRGRTMVYNEIEDVRWNTMLTTEIKERTKVREWNTRFERQGERPVQ